MNVEKSHLICGHSDYISHLVYIQITVLVPVTQPNQQGPLCEMKYYLLIYCDMVPVLYSCNKTNQVY